MSELAKSLMGEGEWSTARLDVDYNARATVGDRFPDEMRAYRDRSSEVRVRWLDHADLVYDAESGQTLDIFGVDPAGSLRPVFLFIHGGYWRALSKLDSSMMAGMLAEEGITTAVMDYRLAPDASLAEIVREVRAALAFLWREGKNYGLDPDRIHVGGSSASGHLAGMLLAGGWQEGFGLPQDVIKSALPVSGLFELAPIAASFAQAWLSLDTDAVEMLSPLRHLPNKGFPIVIAWAEYEAPGFKRQSAAFHEAWTNAGFTSRMLEVPARNHFNILTELSDPRTALSQALIGLVKDST